MELGNKSALLPVTGEIINISNLKQNQYTLSLLQEAFRVELLNRQEMGQIQAQLMGILKDLIMQYTKGESSSVATDTAEGLLNSILYSIDACTLGCSSPEEAIGNLKTMRLEKIYKKGVERVRQWVEETKNLYKEIRKNKLDVPLESYHLTIQEGIPLFFKKYGIVFDAHNTLASIDYPLVLDDTSLRGVLYLKNYLEHLRIETEFCKLFCTRDIEKLLRSFGRMIRADYKIELINIFELVFNNAVFSVLSGGAAGDLRVSKVQFDLLNNKLKPLSPAGISLDIEGAVEKLTHIININAPEMLDYIAQYKRSFTERAVSAAKNDCLGSIIITDKEEKMKGSILLFKDGERMSDDDFKFAIKKLMKLGRTMDKVSFIKSNIGSLHDFVDILNSDCLFGDEFEALFNALGDMELAILTKIVFYQELRGDSASLATVISQKKEGETEWQKHYIAFAHKLSEDRIELIENFFSEIEYEEIKFY